MTLELRRYITLSAFQDASDTYLRANIDVCNQIFTITRSLSDEQAASRKAWLVSLHDGDTVRGVAIICTSLPLRLLLISSLEADGAALVAAALIADGIVPDGVVGSGEGPASLATALRVPTREHVRLGNHVLDSAPLIASAGGGVRSASIDDIDLLVAWEIAFLTECGLPYSQSALPQEMRDRLSAPHPVMWIWEVDGLPVAMTVGRSFPPVARVGQVYTLPEYRGRGYAGALVGQVSAELQKRGCTSIYLFTDLANPTSNGVYKRIGYRYLGAFAHLDVLR
jgi:ribosomal protein S18 acetylase RimI-like enzyme